MGIGRGTIRLLMQEGLRRPFEGKVLTLGKQDISITEENLDWIAKKCGFPLKRVIDLDPLSSKPEMRAQGFLSDVYLMRRLGFDACVSMDYSAYEGCDIVFDLNAPKAPNERFEVIFDGGTLEHVFHFPNALANLFEMTKVQGRIIHASPSSNHIDHGFYMFSPTLFWDYYKANRFEMNQFCLIRHDPRHERWTVWNYEPGCLNDVSYGGLDSGMYAMHCVFTKTQASTAGVIPQQRNYLEGAWKGKPFVSSSRWSRLRRFAKKNAFVHAVLRPLAPLFRPPKGPKIQKIAQF